MANHDDTRHAIPCCPPLEKDTVCDVLDFHYRLTHTVTVGQGDNRRTVLVEVIIHARLERCPGPMTLGDLVYSTTLLPGEKVRLFTSDRRTRFTFDTASSVSYRNEQTSEERFYMSSMSDFMSDLTVRDASKATNTSHGSFEGHGDASGIFGAITGPSVDVSGSHDSNSTSTFVRELSQHAQASHHRTEVGVRAASSVSVGEVQSRTHTEGESEDHYESSSRQVANPNRCHAVTYFFYQINKTQTIKFTIESVQRRVIDPAADTRVTNNQFVSNGLVSVIPNGVLATEAKRLEVESTGRTAAAVAAGSAISGAGSAFAASRSDFGTLLTARPAALAVGVQFAQPISVATRVAALAEVDKQLAAEGLLDKSTNQISDEVKKRFSFEIRSSLPTPGLLVKGCLDDCDTCEPALQKEIDLELERKRLENDLLKRKIELLDKSQEYRCCPVGSEPEENE